MLGSANLEQKLTAFAEQLIARAGDKDTKLEDAVKVFREVRELLSILTPAPEAGDKRRGRRSTIGAMRTRIEAAGGAPKNGRGQPAI